MSMLPTDPVKVVQTPNLACLQNLKNFSTIENLKKAFPILPSHTGEKQWNKTFLIGFIVLGVLATFVYMQARQYIAIGLGILALGVVIKSYQPVENLAFNEQREAITKIFEDVIFDFRKTWSVASDAICTMLAESDYKNIDEANKATVELTTRYKGSSSWSLFRRSNNSFVQNEETEKPWREAFKSYYPHAENFAKMNIAELEKDKDLNPLVVQGLKALHPEAVRLVNGSSPADPAKVYVSNWLNTETGIVVSERWPLKA